MISVLSLLWSLFSSYINLKKKIIVGPLYNSHLSFIVVCNEQFEGLEHFTLWLVVKIIAAD